MGVRLLLTRGSAPNPGSVASGAPMPRAAPSRARFARRLGFASGRACLVAVTVVAGLAFAPPAFAQGPIKRVLVVHGGPPAFPGNAALDAALRKTLFSHPTIQVDAYSEYLENEEFAEAADTSLADSIRIKFANRQLDLVIANTAPALQFVLRHRDELFPNLPVLFAAATTPPTLLQGKVAGVTGIAREPSQIETLDLALQLHPGTKRLHVVAYAPAVAGFRERVEATLANFSSRVAVTYSNEPTLAEMLAALEKLPANSLILYVRYSPVTKGRVIFPDEWLPEIAEAAPVPIYSALETNIGKGVVGGMMRSGTAEAVRLGEMALRILEGTPPRSIPLEGAQVRPIFDWRQLRRWGIDQARLPPGSDIRFEVPTVWELYGSYIMAIVVVVIAQLLLIAGLLRQRARLQSADNTIRASEASLRTSYDRIRQMAGRIINAQEAARADIARDLHDDVCQKLAYVAIGVNTLRTGTGNIADPETQQVFDDLDHQMDSTFDGIRRLSHDLHPATLRLLGLTPALRAHCNEVAKRQGVEVEFSAAEGVGTLHPDVAVCFFRIAQESLRNGIVHGGAKHLAVTLDRSGDQLDLAVVDDGRGFDVHEVRSNGSGGLGLVTMEERINLVGGVLSIVSEPGRGTTVRVRGGANPGSGAVATSTASGRTASAAGSSPAT
jgi:signal transduction histidine kinase